MSRFLKIGGIILAVLLLFALLLAKPARVTVSTILFIPQVFPQIPVRPAEWVSSEPIAEYVEFFSDSKKITGEIWRPNDSKIHPALILTMGVRTAEKDKPLMANFAAALARIGFVVSFANLADLQNLQVRIEEKETFIASVKYLENLPYVDKNKISFVGISVGSSIALKAVEDPQISSQVRGLVFFGGYYDVVDYFSSLITKTVTYRGKEFTWQPYDHVVNHLKEVIISLVPAEEQEILSQVLKEEVKLNDKDFEKLSFQSQLAVKFFEAKTREEFISLWKQSSPEIIKKFESISPSVGVENVKTRLFILHDTADQSVSYFESRKLADALPAEVKKTKLEVSLFEHVQPKGGFSWQLIPELLKLYFFIWRAVFFVS